VIDRDRNGKPCLSGCHERAFSLSNSGDLAVVAVAQDGAAGLCIGIDVERDEMPREADVMVAGFFSRAERMAWAALDPSERRQAFVRLWTRKEAVAKSAGGIKALPFTQLTADPDGQYAMAELPDHRSWRLASWRPTAGYLATLAIMESG
jgi:4'-phosphopantetheinyl transferase